MARRARLDSELVRRGLARSRPHAAELIATGRVLLDGTAATKAATQLDPARAVRVVPPPSSDGTDYVSRGGHKLAGALDALGEQAPRIAGRQVLDAGASTGGFTDVVLQRGAAHVTAVDVGYGQLAWALRNDPRVSVVERTNARYLQPGQLAAAAELVVADLSFISLTLVLPALIEVSAQEADLLLLVKPQFEVGKERIGSGGVVRDPALRAEAIGTVARAATRLGASVIAMVASPLPGPRGNVEYFIHLRTGGTDAETEMEEMIAAAIAAGPAGSRR